MASFRYSGTAWDGQPFRVAGSIKTLGQQITAAFPRRSTRSDGTVASRGHDENNPTSDHTVKPTTGAGIVRAIDITDDDLHGDMGPVAEALRKSKDPRIKYVIHLWDEASSNKPKMFSSYPKGSYKPYTWRPYTGSNPHTSHMHVSVVSTAIGENTGLWDIGDTTVIQPGDEEMFEQFIMDEQDNLNEAGFRDFEGKSLVVDGVPGPRTKSAMLSRDKAAKEHRSAITQSQADARYVMLGTPHTMRKS